MRAADPRALLPIFVLLLVLAGVYVFSQGEPDAIDVPSESKPIRDKPARKLLPTPGLGVDRRAEPFPHNLETFDDWGSISVEEMATYKASLTARIGSLDAAGVGAFYFSNRDGITDPDALQDFQEAVLGVWCAKDVEDCLNTLREDLEEPVADAAMQDALAGWASEDWITALRFLQKYGDVMVEARVGGDSSRYVKQLISQVADANGVADAEEVASYLRSAKNSAGAAGVIESLKSATQ